MTRLCKRLLILFCIVTITGCKLAIVVTSGGQVVSQSGSYTCNSVNVCEIEITTDDFNETFTAIPAEGYEFEKWQGGPGFNCPDSTNPTCLVTNTGYLTLLGAAAATHIASDKIDHLMPIFKWVGIDSDGDGTPNRFDDDDDNDGLLDIDDPCPLNPDQNCGTGNFIVADGKIWFQPDAFRGISWTDINAVCAGGPCNGVVSGFNMNNWTWASISDVQSLFNSYGAFWSPLQDCVAVDNFYNDGWRNTNSVGVAPGGGMIDLVGWTSGGYSGAGDSVWLNSCAGAALEGYSSFISGVGAWFYQQP